MEKSLMSIFDQNSLFQQTKTPRDDKSIFYTVRGEENCEHNSLPCRDTEDDKVYAKAIPRNNGSTKFMIRLDYSAKLFNPLSIYDSTEKETTRANNFLNSVCRNNKRFKEVNEKTFQLYLKFLDSGNVLWLHNAEREVL